MCYPIEPNKSKLTAQIFKLERHPQFAIYIVRVRFIIKIMYYKEEIINGILHYKLTPNGEWQEVSKETLSKRTKEAEAKVWELTQQILS